MEQIQTNAETAVRKFLQKTARRIDRRKLEATDYLDNGTRIQLQISIREDGSATFDFTGTGPEVVGNNNAPKSICLSAIIYSLRCLINDEIPLNQGCLSCIDVVNPEGSILNPSEHAAVYAGNTQTSQRIVDVILKAFDVRLDSFCVGVPETNRTRIGVCCQPWLYEQCRLLWWPKHEGRRRLCVCIWRDHLWRIRSRRRLERGQVGDRHSNPD